MKKLLMIIALVPLMGASCERRPTIEPPKYPANALVECPELQQLVIDEKIDGTTLRDYYIDRTNLNKQYADCATIHNELVRFIKTQQKR